MMDYFGDYPLPCADCANETVANERALRGGYFLAKSPGQNFGTSRRPPRDLSSTAFTAHATADVAADGRLRTRPHCGWIENPTE